MEVATTGLMGELLIAPKFPGASWSYELVSHVRLGDRILHWQSDGSSRAVVGWSVVTDDPEVVPEYSWQPRGTAGREMSGPRTTEGWMVTLGGLNRFTNPVTSEQLQQRIEPVLGVAGQLERLHGKPTYFPFYLYGGAQLRAQQGYLVKFPSELLELVPALAEAAVDLGSTTADDEEEPEPRGGQTVFEDDTSPGSRVRAGTLTRVQDPVLRSAIENHAVDRAIDFYRALGGTGFKKLGKPYDIQLTLDGEELHVEVKGSSLQIETVELTTNEVGHARSHVATDLVVVDSIQWHREGDVIHTRGGNLRRWPRWEPSDEHLRATKYAYTLPPWGSSRAARP